MDAIILAAGYATRLYPLTLDTPKPLLGIAGRPMIEHVLDKLAEVSPARIFIVTNSKFYPVFQQWLQHYPQKNITMVNDQTTGNEDRLGAVGDIHFTLAHHAISDDILIVAGDNLFDLSLREFLAFAAGRPSIVSHDVKDRGLAKLYGIVSINAAGRITSFEEKPAEPASTLASTCIYFFPRKTIPAISEYIAQGNPTDKSGHFIQWLSEKTAVYSMVTEKPWFDIGSKEQLEEVRRWKQSS